MATVVHEPVETVANVSPAPSSLRDWLPSGGALVALALVIAYASFLETDPTRNDFERFEDQRLLVLFLGLLVGFGLAYVRAVLQPPRLTRGAIAGLALVALAAMCIAAPIGSRDLYLYAFYGKIGTTYGLNPYVRTVSDFVNDPWQAYVQMQWSTRHMIYGPLFFWQTWIVTALAGDNIFYAVWGFKLLAAVMLTGVWYLVSRLEVAPRTPSASPLLLIAWNPLLLFELGGNGHNDVTMVLLIVAALWCWQRQRLELAVALLAVSFWYKWYGLIVLPAFLLAALKEHGMARTVRLAIVAAVGVVGTGGLVLASQPGAAEVIVGELYNPLALTQIYPTELSPLLAPWFWLLHYTGALATARGTEIFHLGRSGVFVLAVVAIGIRQWRQPASLQALCESAFLTVLAFTMLLITILWPWHLVVPITLGLLTGRPIFIAIAVGLTLAGLLSYFLTFTFASIGLVLIVGALALLRRGSAAQTAAPVGV